MLSQNDKSNLIKVMIFYSMLSYLVGPSTGYYLTKSKAGITNGMLAGSAVSISLWYMYGAKLIELK